MEILITENVKLTHAIIFPSTQKKKLQKVEQKSVWLTLYINISIFFY